MSDVNIVNGRSVASNDTDDIVAHNGESLSYFCATLGILIICSSIFVANFYIVSSVLFVIAFFLSVFGKSLRFTRINLSSMMSANPVNITSAIPCNIVFAPWIMLFDVGSIFLIPRWIFVATLLSLLSFTCSSINWITGSGISSILSQIGYMLSYLLGPLILMPIIYSRLSECKDSNLKLKGLIFYLIIPSTALLLLAHFFGQPIQNSYQDTNFAMNTRMYKFGNMLFNFTRTHVGFILASLICASTAVAASKVKKLYRLLATACLAGNILLLLITGSVGSAIACICGLFAILLIIFKRSNIIRALTMIFAITVVLGTTWVLAPQSVKKYTEDRYQERFKKKGRLNAEDRLMLWGRASKFLIKNPEGVGWSVLVGDKVKSNPHNDYLLYAISYGVLAGIIYAYTILRLLFYFYTKASKRLLDQNTQAVTLAGLGVAIVIMINSMSDHLIANRWYFSVIWSILWFAYFSSRQDKEQTSIQSI